MDVLIVMPVWNLIRTTQRCLAALMSVTDFSCVGRHEVYVVDNGSTDGVGAWLDEFATYHSNLHIIHNSVNVGQCLAINQALAYRPKGWCVVKMDNDTEVLRADWLLWMARVAGELSKVGLVGLWQESLDHLHGFTRTTVKIAPDIEFSYAGLVYGPCNFYSDGLLNDMGGLWEPGLYGWEDHCTSMRVKALNWQLGWLAGNPQFMRHGKITAKEREDAELGFVQFCREERKRFGAPDDPNQFHYPHRAEATVDHLYTPLPPMGTIYGALP